MDADRQRGMAMVVAIMAMLMMSTLGIALVLATTTETMVSANFGNSVAALYAADAALGRVLAELRTTADLSALVGGSSMSAFVDGPAGMRVLADGTSIDLARVVNVANCGKSSCTAGDLTAVAPERPWGANNPQWRLFAHGNLRDLLPADAVAAPFYVVVMVADDPSENDGNALQDGTAPCPEGSDGLDGSCNPGSGVVALRAEAFGPRGARRPLEVTVTRPETAEPGIRVLSWREIR